MRSRVEHWVRNENPVGVGLILGALGAGFLGGIVGFIIGWSAHPQTAWAAYFEVGIPAAVLESVIGALVGARKATARRSSLCGR